MSVTSAFWARARPCAVTLSATVIVVKARMLPTNVDPVSSVAELPTCQKTLHAWAPLIRDTVLPEPVIRVESVWKMKTELGLPSPSRVRVPARDSGDWLGPAYTPPTNVRPVRSEVVVSLRGRPKASMDAAVD